MSEAEPFCRWCGRASQDCDGVAGHRDLNPPHFCPTCGRRMRVQVSPTAWSASCRDHGSPGPAPATPS